MDVVLFSRSFSSFPLLSWILRHHGRSRIVVLFWSLCFSFRLASFESSWAPIVRFRTGGIMTWRISVRCRVRIASAFGAWTGTGFSIRVFFTLSSRLFSCIILFHNHFGSLHTPSNRTCFSTTERAMCKKRTQTKLRVVIWNTTHDQQGIRSTQTTPPRTMPKTQRWDHSWSSPIDRKSCGVRGSRSEYLNCSYNLPHSTTWPNVMSSNDYLTHHCSWTHIFPSVGSNAPLSHCLQTWLIHRKPGPHHPSLEDVPSSYGHALFNSGCWDLIDLQLPASSQYSFSWQSFIGSSTPDVPGTHVPHCSQRSRKLKRIRLLRWGQYYGSKRLGVVEGAVDREGWPHPLEAWIDISINVKGNLICWTSII